MTSTTTTSADSDGGGRRRARVTFPRAALDAHALYRRRGGARTSALRLARPSALVAMYRTCGADVRFTGLPDVLLTHIAEYATCCNAPVFNGAEAGTVVILG